MRAGQLRNRIELQSLVETKDAMSGSLVKTYATFATVWASVLEFSGAEQYAARTQIATRLIEVRLRYRSDVTERTRVLLGARVFNVVAIGEDRGGRLRELILTCEELS
jgi:SPP1 family predicted phage head-tail adaptor